MEIAFGLSLGINILLILAAAGFTREQKELRTSNAALRTLLALKAANKEKEVAELEAKLAKQQQSSYRMSAN